MNIPENYILFLIKIQHKESFWMQILNFMHIENVEAAWGQGYTVEPLYSGHPWDSLKCPD